jgi:hypothetical protein
MTGRISAAAIAAGADAEVEGEVETDEGKERAAAAWPPEEEEAAFVRVEEGDRTDADPAAMEILVCGKFS